MEPADKHFKFINSMTGYAIFYHTVKSHLKSDELKAELEKVRSKVAIQNEIMFDTVYWEEIKGDDV
jgi:hypothetical protein